MNFYPDQLFHVFNHGNNRQLIFLKEAHYQFFLWKMKAYLLPFADIVSYCLMPTHFHWQIFVRLIEVDARTFWEHVDSTEKERRARTYGERAKPVQADGRLKNRSNTVVLNEAIGILQMAYTKAINKENKWTGSLFRKECKSKDGWLDGFIALNKIDGKPDYRFTMGSDYAYTCFQYIHNNPKAAGLVQDSLDWPYSSAREYAGLIAKPLCNLKLGMEILGLR